MKAGQAPGRWPAGLARAWLAVAAVAGLALSGMPLAGAGAPREQAAAPASLSILAGTVEVATGGGAFSPARDGQALQPGDQLRTSSNGVALLTFPGSETQLTSRGQLQILAEPDAGGAILFQAAGTSVSRVTQPADGSAASHGTDTPAAHVAVSGTTYVVTVKRLDVSEPPPAAAPPPEAPALPRAVEGSPFLLLAESAYVDAGEQWRARSWQDPSDGSTWDTYEDLGPADQPAADQPAAASAEAPARATEELGPAPCTPDEAASCVTSVVLLADPDGRVGRVALAPHGAAAAVELTDACDVGAAIGAAAAAATLGQEACASLQRSARDLHDWDAAAPTQWQAELVARERAMVVAPSAPPLPEPTALPTAVDGLGTGTPTPIGTGTATAAGASRAPETPPGGPTPAPTATATPPPTTTPLPVPSVKISATSLGFGEQVVGTTASAQPVILTNSGSGRLVFGSRAAPAEFALGDPTSCGSELQPNESCVLSVSFTPAEPGRRRGELTITSNAKGSPHTVALEGKGVAPPAPSVSVSPASVSFGDQELGTISAARMVTVTNSGRAGAFISGYSASGDFFPGEGSSCGMELAAGERCVIMLSFVPTAVGERTGELTVASDGSGSTPTVALRGTGTAPPFDPGLDPGLEWPP